MSKCSSLSDYFSDLKSTNSVNSFKHKIKDNVFQNIQREEKYIYVLLKPRILSHIHVSALPCL